MQGAAADLVVAADATRTGPNCPFKRLRGCGSAHLEAHLAAAPLTRDPFDAPTGPVLEFKCLGDVSKLETAIVDVAQIHAAVIVSALRRDQEPACWRKAVCAAPI